MLTEDRTAVPTFDRVASDLAHLPFLTMASALRARIDRILKHWRRLSLKAMPHRDALDADQFEEAVAVILSDTADALESADPQELRGVIKSEPQHGIDRFVQKESLLDLFEEVRLLRGVIIVELAEEMGRPFYVAEAATFHAIFDIIIQQGVMALVQKQGDRLSELQGTMRAMNEQLLSTDRCGVPKASVTVRPEGASHREYDPTRRSRPKGGNMKALGNAQGNAQGNALGI